MLDTLVRHLSMVRLSIGAAAVIMMVGCTGLIGSSGDGLSPNGEIALDKWEHKALPVLQTNCVGCHGPAFMANGAPGFLVGDTDLAIRTTLLGFSPQIIDLDAPPSSQMLTKGIHNGPALTAQNASDILEWIKAEAVADAETTGGDTGPTLQLFTPLTCTGGNASDTVGCSSTPADPTHCCPLNHLDLTAVGLPGAHLDFVWEALDAGDAYVKNLQLFAAGPPSTDGAYIEHPLFVSWPVGGQAKPDSLDRFFDVKLNLMPGAASMVDGGAAAFIGFAPTDKISIHFKKVDKFEADTTTTMPSGCRQLAAFKTNAQAQFVTNCISCHAGTSNPQSHAAVDMDGMNAADDPTIQLACNQIRVNANLQTTESSAFYLAPDPASATGHPFKFPTQAAYTTFHTAVDIWVQAEKTSP